MYSRLSPADRQELEGHIHVFLAEKRFEGCGGQEITDEVRVLIAAQACLLLLHRDTDCYPLLYSILVYPSSYIAKTWHWGKDGTITEGEQARGGESWPHGTVVLAWDGAIAGAVELNKNRNLVIHEFAHQLDEEDGVADGAPLLSGSTNLWQIHHRYQTWAKVLSAEFHQLRRAAEDGRETVLDTYGAQNPAEFFAVATECFFEKSAQLKERHPALYAELKEFYRQDPLLYAPASPEKNEYPA